MNRLRSNQGYLLAELLCAILLIAIAAAAIAPVAFNQLESSIEKNLGSLIVDFDRRARIASIADGPVIIKLDTDANVLYLINQHEQIASEAYQRSVFMLDQDGRPVQEVEFDRLGRSTNYTIHILSDHESISILHFDGFSGRVYREEHPDA